MTLPDILYSPIEPIQKRVELRPDKDLIDYFIDAYRRGRDATEILRAIERISRVAQDSGRIVTYNGYTYNHEDREKHLAG